MMNQKDLTAMQNKVNKIENQGEMWYKMTDFSEKLGQH